MRLKEEYKNVLIGLLLAIVLILQLVGAILDSQQREKIVERENIYLDLIHHYNIFHAVASKLESLQNKEKLYIEWRWAEIKVKDHNIYNTLSNKEKEDWGNKTILELLYYDMKKIADTYRDRDKKILGIENIFQDKIKSIADKINILNRRKNIVNFVSMILLVLSLFMYLNLLKTISQRTNKS